MIPEVNSWLRESRDHKRVVDLKVDGRYRCICIDCWRSWPEGADWDEYPAMCAKPEDDAKR